MPWLLSVNITVPPLPVPCGWAFMNTLSPNVSTPLTEFVLAVKLTLPPVPLVVDASIVLDEFIVKFRPAEIFMVPPLPEVEPPVACIEFTVISLVAPLAVKVIVPPLPVVVALLSVTAPLMAGNYHQ